VIFSDHEIRDPRVVSIDRKVPSPSINLHFRFGFKSRRVTIPPISRFTFAFARVNRFGFGLLSELASERLVPDDSFFRSLLSRCGRSRGN